MSDGKVFRAVGKGILEIEWPSSFTKKEMNVIERFIADVHKNADGLGGIYDILIEDDDDEPYPQEEVTPEVNERFNELLKKFMEEE